MMSQQFEIVVCGLLPAAWSETFGGMRVISQPNGKTRICGPLADQAALYGLLMCLRDWGLSLVSVNPSSPTTGQDAEKRPMYQDLEAVPSPRPNRSER